MTLPTLPIKPKALEGEDVIKDFLIKSINKIDRVLKKTRKNYPKLLSLPEREGGEK